jgi:hypothetical protein
MVPIILGSAAAYVAGWYLFGKLRLDKNRGKILAFHDISDSFGFTISRVNINNFERIIDYLAERGYSGRSLSECKNETDIALTFDDGLENFYLNAYPILQRHNFTATVFLVTDFVGKPSSWDYHKRMHMNWHQISELAAAGIEFGSHSASHCDLRYLEDDDLEIELTDSKMIIENQLGRPVKHISYPFGRFNKHVMEYASKIGYEAGYALVRGEGEMAKSRICVYLYDTPYSINLKLDGFWAETCKDYINNSLAGGTIMAKKLFPEAK